jgi:SAM-dependent methyltransferase
MESPWFNIPAVVYETHMSSPKVDQLSFLGRIFRKALNNNGCDTVALLGCATGNGLEYINNDGTRRVSVIDFNPEYLEILRQRYEEIIPGLEIIEADLEICTIENNAYSLVFAGLIFEYLDPEILLAKIADGLHLGGVMVTVLQLPAEHVGKVSETSYASLNDLESIMKFISPQDFKSMAYDAGLKELEAEIVTLESGKPFYIGTYTKCNLGK